MKTWCHYAGRFGPMLLAARAAGLAGVYFVGQKYAPSLSDDWREDAAQPLLREAARQLDEYFAGQRLAFELPLAAAGTPFQLAVWRAIAAVPYGATISYAELAHQVGRPGSARAAGTATGRNPLGVVVPCHRIVGSDGRLTGYAGGLALKERLLALEGALPA